MSRGPPARSIGPPHRNGGPEPKENDVTAERVKFPSSPPSQPAQDQSAAGAVTPNPSPDDHGCLRHLREVAKESAEVARVLAHEGVARDPTLASEAIFREFCDIFDARCGELAAGATWVEGRA